MKEWLKISGLLCIFGFIREIRPSEPYITEFLLGEWRNVTQDEVNREVFPVGTYSHLAQLVIVFLITDLWRYKPLIIVTGISGIIVWSMLLWTTSLQSLQIVEFFYGTYMASEVAYYTYIYAKVDKKYYPKVTSHTRAAMLAGKLVASLLAQILLYCELMNYRDLNYISLGTQICATVWAFTLPKVDNSLYFHRKDPSTENIVHESNQSVEIDVHKKKTLNAFHLLWSHFVSAYTNVKVVQWSIWYSVGLCGYLQVYSYIQILWMDIDPDPSVVWNGAVDAALTLLGAIFALSAGYLHAGRLNPRASLLVLAGMSIAEGLAILLSCWAKSLYLSYIGYILFGALYAFTITVASAEVARYLTEDSFGLVFGINTLFALIFQTILTLVVVTPTGLALNIINQYTVYAFYFIVIGFIYFISVVVEYFTQSKISLPHNDDL